MSKSKSNGAATMTVNGVEYVRADAVQKAEPVRFVRPKGVPPCPFEVGKAYLIRTVTMAWTGLVRDIVGGFLILDSAAWIADIGRYSQALSAENLSEVEVAGDGILLALGAIVDARPWTTALPAATK